jgi:hypothetical protein
MFIIGSSERKAEEETTKAATRFVCIPGVMPVNVPAVTPQSKAMMISRIIWRLLKG